MTEILPMLFLWDAERAVMVPRRPHYACKVYVDQQEYRLGQIEERSTASHAHLFAAIHEAWLNLPTEVAERFPTDTHFRRYCLIRAGFCDTQEFLASSKAEAVRIASFLRSVDEFSIVVVKANVVQRLTAKSQSYRSMPRKEFNDSSQKVLEVAASMINVQPAALAKAGKAA